MHRYVMMAFVPLISLLAGCGNSDKVQLAQNSALPTGALNTAAITIDDYVVDVSADRVLTLIASKEHFLLYIGNDGCSACVNFKPILAQYINETRAMVYHFDNLTRASEYLTLPAAYPDYFLADYPITPSLFFFKDGVRYAYRIGSKRLFDYATMKPIMDGYSTISPMTFAPTLASAESYVSTDGFVFFYDRTNAAENAFYVNTLFPDLIAHKTAFRVVDVAFLGLDETSEPSFLTTFGISAASGLIAYYEDGVPSEIKDVTVDTATSILAWIHA